MKKPQLDKNRIINEVFQLVLKTMVESFVNAIPKETVVSIYNAMNAEFVKFKDPILSQLKGSPLIKTCEKIWDSVKEIFAVILQPMISVVSNNLASNLIRKEEDSDSLHVDDSLWMPAGISIVNHKSASDVITIKTKIIALDSAKTMVVPKTIFDTGSDSSLMSSNIVRRLELDVDKTNAPDLSGVATKSDTMGTTYGLGISIYDSDNDKTIEDNFMVIKSMMPPLFLMPLPLLMPPPFLMLLPLLMSLPPPLLISLPLHLHPNLQVFLYSKLFVDILK